MRIPTMLQDKSNCQSPELLLSRCLGDLYLQFLGMNRASKRELTTIRCYSDSSRASCSSGEFAFSEDITLSPSDLHSSFSGLSSPVVLSECEFEADPYKGSFGEERCGQIAKHELPLSVCLNEELCSTEVNTFSYGNISVPSSFTSLVDVDAGMPHIVESCEAVSFRDCQNDGERGRVAAARAACHNLSRQSFPRVKLMFSFGGRILPRPCDGKFRYVGGETRIIAVSRNILYAELMSKLTEWHTVALTLKYQLPNDDLDALVSVLSDDDLQNMMEEYDRLDAAGGSSRLRLFLFPATEYDDYNGQNAHNSDKQYVDSVNGISMKNHFESGIPLSAKVQDKRRLPCTSNSLAVNQSAMHGAASRQVSSAMSFSGTPSKPSSGPASPPLPSQQPYVKQHPVASDISLQCFRDRLKKLSVHRHGPMNLDTFFQDRDPEGSGGPGSGQRDQQLAISDFLAGSYSSKPTIFEIAVSKGDDLYPRDSTPNFQESQCKSANVFEQQFEYSAINSNAHADTQWLCELLSPQLELPDRVQQQQSHHQQQHKILQKQQHGENSEAVKVVHHNTCFWHQAVQQPSLCTSLVHSWDTIKNGVSKQMEHCLIYEEGCLPETSLGRSISQFPSHAVGIGGQSAYDLSSASTYHNVRVPPSLTIAPEEHVKSHVQANGYFCDSCVDQPHGRRVQYSDQNTENVQVSLSCSRFMPSAEERGVKHQQQYPTLFASRFPELGEHSSVHLCDLCPLSWNQLPSSLTSPFSPIYSEASTSCSLEQTRAECHAVCLDVFCDEPISNPISSKKLNSRLDCDEIVSLVSKHVPYYPSYGNTGESYDNNGGWIGTCACPQMGFSNKGKLLEVEGCICDTDGFNSLNGGCVANVSYPLTDCYDSFATMPVTLYPSSSAFHATPVSTQVSPKLRGPNQFSMIAASRSSEVLDLDGISGRDPRIQHCTPHTASETLPSFHLMVEQKCCSHLLTPDDAHDRSIDSRDAGNSLNGAHKLEELSICKEISHEQNACIKKNQTVASASFPDEAVKWVMSGPNKNELNEEMHKVLSKFIETFDLMQTTSESVSPCTLILEKSSDSSGCLGFPASMTNDVNDCSSTQLLSDPCQWHALCSAVNASEQHEVSNISGLPVYDRSPVGSVRTILSRGSLLDSDKVGAPCSVSDNGASTCQMSLTERLANNMISSVLESSGKEIIYNANGSHQEQENNELEIGKEDVKNASQQLKDVSLLMMQDEIALRETVKGMLGPLAEEQASSKEMNQETLEHIVDNEAGNKVMNCCVAEREALSHGLQIIKNTDLEEIKELGSGTFGTVYHGKWKGSDVAIKRIKASCFTGPVSEQKRLMSDFWKEACTLAQLHHPNVVAFYGLVPDGPDGTLATITEYMVNGSLKQVLNKKDRTIDRRKRLLIAMDIAFGMEYLHSKNIVHFDLKCDNFLVNMRDPLRPICKVGDFGLSKVKQHTLVSGGVRGTLPWMAPELLSGNNRMVTEKIDVYSFGIVMWELLTGEEPYANMHCGAILAGIVNNTLRPSVPTWCDPAWRSLMERCWSADPADRPAFSEVSCELRGIAATMKLK